MKMQPPAATMKPCVAFRHTRLDLQKGKCLFGKGEAAGGSGLLVRQEAHVVCIRRVGCGKRVLAAVLAAHERDRGLAAER